MSEKSLHIIWIDLEMTGLNPNRDRILEVGALVTDAQLNPLDQGRNWVIHQSQELLSKMNAWNQSHHGQSGLIKAVKRSMLLEAEVERELLSYLKGHTHRRQCPIAGSSVQSDLFFLRKYMPLVYDHLYYRVIDVSTIKELARRWSPKLLQKLSRQPSEHRALQDIYSSIALLRYFRDHFFYMGEGVNSE